MYIRSSTTDTDYTMSRFHLLLGCLAASIGTVVAVVIVHDPLPAPADPFEGLHLAAPIEDDVIEDEILNAPFVSYKSETHTYSLRFPGNWSLDDTRAEFEGDILADPLERAVITISETKDTELVTDDGIARMAESIEESLRLDPSFKLQTLDQFLWKGKHTIFTDGVRKIGGKRFHTREYNIFRPQHGGVLNLSITTQEDSEPLYEKALQDILHSLSVCPKELSLGI